MKKIFILSAFCAFLLSMAQAFSFQAEEEVPKQDTVKFAYRFMPKDTLVYYSSTLDSSILGYNKYLVKNRYQRTMVICDSVNKAGTRFFLKMAMIDFISIEKDENRKDVVNKNSNWLNKWVHIEIDSAANRYSYDYEDTVNAVVCPGGVFDSYLFFALGAYDKQVNTSWLNKAEALLPENGMPFPAVKYSSLLRALPDIDTLGRACHQLRFVRTGQGSYYVNAPGNKFAVTSIFDGGGFLRIDKQMFVPVHFYHTNMIKIKVGIDDETAQTIIQNINTNWILESHSRYGYMTAGSGE